MKSKILAAVGFAVILATGAAPALAQQNAIPKNIADSVGVTLHYVEGEFLSVAQAMPEDKYSFIPSVSGGNFEGVRSFAEQVKHVACANFAFFNEIEGQTPPEECEKRRPLKGANEGGADSVFERLIRLRESHFGDDQSEKCTRSCRRAICRAEY